jgi:hypothetical protein
MKEIGSFHCEQTVDRERVAEYLASAAGPVEVELGLGGGSPPGGGAADEKDKDMQEFLNELTPTDPDRL